MTKILSKSKISARIDSDQKRYYTITELHVRKESLVNLFCTLTRNLSSR